MGIIRKIKTFLDPAGIVENFDAGNRVHRMLYAAVCLMLLLAAVNYLSTGIFGQFLSNNYDYRVTYEAGRKILDRAPDTIYDGFFAAKPGGEIAYSYPAPVALLFSPLSHFDYGTAGVLLKLLTQAFLLLSFFLVTELAGAATKPEKLLCFFLFFNFFPCYYSAYLGQFEFFMLALLLLSFRCFQRREDTLSAFFLALAILFKLFPAVFLAWFLWKREYAYCLRVLAALALLEGASMLVVSPHVQEKYFLGAASLHWLDSFIDNQSLAGFFSRLMAKSYYADGLFRSELPKNILLYASYAAVLYFTGKATGSRLARTDERYRQEFSHVFILMLLVSRLTTGQHFTFLIFPLCCLFIYCLRDVSCGVKPLAGLSACYAFFALNLPLIIRPLTERPTLYKLLSGLPLLLTVIPFFFLAALYVLSLRMLKRRTQTP